MKIYYIANARMPNEKAHCIQIAKMCEAFIGAGIDLTLMVPSHGSGSLKEAYALTHNIPLWRLPVLDLHFLGSIGYLLTVLQFDILALLYLWAKVFDGEHFVLYTIDMDSFSFIPFVLMPRPVFAEMHSTKQKSVLRRWFFKRANVIATNTLIGEQLTQTFNIPPERLRIEPNGVDESALQNAFTKEEARQRLRLPDVSFALYVGRFYAWKGLGILADVAMTSPLPTYVVGGTQAEYERITGKKGGELHFMGAKPVTEIPLWLAAADVLLVLGTARNEDSYRYTAPMKIFEYLAACRSLVASRTPALASIIGEDVAFWYEPDNTASLAAAIHEASTSAEVAAKIVAGRTLAARHTWRARAKRILSFCSSLAGRAK